MSIQDRLNALKARAAESRRLNQEALSTPTERKRKNEEDSHQGSSSLQSSLLTEPAFSAKRKPHISTSTDPILKAHEKRLATLKTNPELYKKHMQDVLSGSFAPTEEAKEAVARTVKQAQAKHREFSKKSVFNESEDVHFINEKNRLFNRGLKKSFGESTAAIKQALERGSAI